MAHGYLSPQAAGESDFLGSLVKQIGERIKKSSDMALEERRYAEKKAEEGGTSLDEAGIEKGYFFKRALGSSFGGDKIARTRGRFEKDPGPGRDPTGTQKSRFRGGFDYDVRNSIKEASSAITRQKGGAITNMGGAVGSAKSAGGAFGGGGINPDVFGGAMVPRRAEPAFRGGDDVIDVTATKVQENASISEVGKLVVQSNNNIVESLAGVQQAVIRVEDAVESLGRLQAGIAQRQIASQEKIAARQLAAAEESRFTADDFSGNITPEAVGSKKNKGGGGGGDGEGGGGGLLDKFGGILDMMDLLGGRRKGTRRRNARRKFNRNNPFNRRNRRPNVRPRVRPGGGARPPAVRPPGGGFRLPGLGGGSPGGGVKPPAGVKPGGGFRMPGMPKVKAGGALSLLFAGMEFADRKSQGQTNTQAAIGTAGSTAGGVAGAALGAKGGAAAGAAIGAMFGGVGAIPGAAIGGLIGMLGGGMLGGMAGGAIADTATGANNIPSGAGGMFSSGPLSGYLSLLHGKELTLSGEGGKETENIGVALGKGIINAQFGMQKKVAELAGKGLKHYYDKMGGNDKLKDVFGWVFGEDGPAAGLLKGLKDIAGGFAGILGQIGNALLGGAASAATNPMGAAGYLTDGSVEGNKKAIYAAIKDAGFDDKSASNMLAQIQGESGFQMIAEQSYANTSVADIRRALPDRVSHLSDAQIETLKKNPEAFFNEVYSSSTMNERERMGNAVGEGYKYRGRGFIQLTGKNNYKAIGDKIGVDLVNNPDLMNDPGIAAKATVAFYQRAGANNQNMQSMTGAYNAIFRGNANLTKLDTKDQERVNQRSGIASQLLSQMQSGQLTPAARTGPASAGSRAEGTGLATFGETDGGSGRLVNAAGYVHGHFQTNTGTKQDVVNDTAAVVRAMLNSGLTDISISDGTTFLPSMSDSEIKGLIERGLAQHTHSGDGRSVDIFVPKGTPVPFPLTDVRNAGNAGRTGMLPGTGHTWVGHLTPDSQAGANQKASAHIAAEPDSGGGGGTQVASTPGSSLTPEQKAKMFQSARMPAFSVSAPTSTLNATASNLQANPLPTAAAPAMQLQALSTQVATNQRLAQTMPALAQIVQQNSQAKSGSSGGGGVQPLFGPSHSDLFPSSLRSLQLATVGG